MGTHGTLIPGFGQFRQLVMMTPITLAIQLATKTLTIPEVIAVVGTESHLSPTTIVPQAAMEFPEQVVKEALTTAP